MYRLKSKIKDVNYYVLSDKHLFFKQNDDIIYKNKILEKNVGDDIILTGDNIFYNKGENGFFAYELKNDNKHFFDNYAILNVKPMFLKKGIIINNDNQLYLFDKFNFNKEKINVIDYNWGIILFNEEYIFTNDINKISSYHIPTAQPLWQFDLSQLGTFQNYNNEKQAYKVEKFIGIHNNELLVACNNHCILSINVDAGSILYNFSLNELDLYQDGKQFPIAKGFVYDSKNEKMFSFYGRYYIEIDIKTREIEFVDIQNSLSQYDISVFRASMDYAYNETHIFTIAERDILKLGIDWLQRSLVAFNRKTKTIDWQYVFEDTGINTDAPKLAGNKLYQLDGVGNLYIFENENI